MTPETFATDLLPRAEQFEAWHDWYGTVFDTTVRDTVGKGFPARNVMWRVGSVMICRGAAPGLHTLRSRALIRRNPVDHWVLTVNNRGATRLTTSGISFEPRPGAPFILSLADEMESERSTFERVGILIMARTDCRPTQGIDEAVARIEMYVEEGADILFLDSPADDAEIKRGIVASKGKPHFVVLSPGGARATPSQKEAEKLGFKIGTFPTGMLSPAAAGMKAGLAALKAGESEAKGALPPPELRGILGYGDYDTTAKPFVLAGR